jgi:hypothetical protein
MNEKLYKLSKIILLANHPSKGTYENAVEYEAKQNETLDFHKSEVWKKIKDDHFANGQELCLCFDIDLPRVLRALEILICISHFSQDKKEDMYATHILEIISIWTKTKESGKSLLLKDQSESVLEKIYNIFEKYATV